MNTLKIPNVSRIINISIAVCLYVLVGNAAVDLVPCDRTRRVFTDTWGVITDGPLGTNYTQDSHCEWLIKANGTKKFITLSFRSMGTECSYDYVFVYDGDSFRSPLLGSFSGKTEPQRVVAASGHMLILLYSDTNYVLEGFRAEFSITNCANNCSGHGVCFKNRCTCDGDWGGFDCSRKVCPDDCGRKYSHGRCVAGICVCNDGYSGQSCSLYRRELKGNRWHWLSHSEGGLTPRAAHSAVYVEATDSLYVFGGYNLNYVLSNLEIYSFSNSTWYDENGQPLPDRTISSTIDPSSIAKLIEHAGPDWEHKWGINSGTSFLRNLFYTVSDNSTFPRRRQRHSKFPDSKKPSARFGHAACVVPDGFLIYGGKLDNGSLSNDLWLYDVRRNKWELRAALSDVQPPPLTRHTLTLANGSVYLFGGSTSDGEFSSLLYSIRLRPSGDEKWVLVKPRGGKELDVRVVAHSTVYHEPSNSLLVYGGIKAGIARFSKLSDRMFAFDLERKHWAEIHYTRGHLRENFVPSERAFHTANILGNYLVVFGGYSHRHNKDEICYDNQMYLYHLGCHIWVNPEILGKTNGSAYPKQQGVFAHASAIRLGNTLLLVGGYHGNVNGDLLAYTVPPMIASHSGEPYDPEAVCSKHHHYTECSADPECGWCSADDSCYGRMIGTNCTTNLQTTRCPGVCPALGDCRSCLIHGDAAAATKRPLASAAQKLGLGVCTWCVQNARCHHKDDNYGVCGLREDSPSKMPGWWGSAGTEVDSAEKCRELDKRPGLTFVKYHHPANFSQPDHVAIINATTVDFSGPLSYSLRLDSFSGGRMVARLMGFLRPPAGWRETLDVCVSYCNASLRLSEDVLVNVSASHTECGSAQWPENLTSHRVPVDLEAQKTVSIGPYNNRQDEQSKMELQHRSDGDDPAKVFTFEYLEPYANGTCSQYQNCLHCLTDSECGWCEAPGACVSRHDDENVTCSSAGNDGSDWRYLTLQPAACPNCSDHISCESCVSTRTCEWWLEEAKCARIGQAPDAAVSPHQCPTPCYKRADCTGCLEERGRCVWCEATQQCFSFSVYTSEYQFGMCRVWLDQVYPLAISQDNGIIQSTKVQEKCKSCSHHDNCSNCLSSLSCGWCYNASNPMTGVCVQGDFNAPHSNCSELLSTSEARWAYAQCPDVDECGLGLHDCHPQAVCTNTDGSFSCHCRKGYVGDGRTTCRRTCYNVCVHGVCQEEPDYSCRCDLGWFGDDCSKNCGCNNHSMCPQGEGVCEKCMDWTTGERCEFCVPGSYGNATTEQGCRECSCNGHGDKLRGECDIATGVCFCQDNTEGEKCEKCKVNYWGDPRNGRQCYYQCEARGMLSGPKGQGISSRQAYSAPWGGTPIRECLWIINPQVESGGVIIQLQVNASDLNVTCGENAVYVYDSSPDLLDMGSQSALSAVLCSEEALPSAIVESRTGQLTVHYKQGLAGEGFSAIYKVIHCGDDCEFPRRCRNGQCVCEDGLSGPRCELILCPNNCSYSLNRGTCNKDYGRCICKPGWAGPSCDTKITGKELVFVELFNTMHLAEHLEHLRKTLPRFGHSLATDRRGSLWMFGGYSLSHGPLNDIRLFDTRNSTWNQVTVESTPDAKMPRGRYFHGADIVHSKQAIYIYGGLTRAEGTDNTTLDDLWQFDIQNQRWGKVEQKGDWPPSLCGHTLTYYRNATTDSLILIGGVSPEFGFSSSVWEFQIQGKEKWTLWQTKGKGPLGIFGHSTVFHMQSNSLYIFGGYEHERQRSLLSNKLYRLQYETRTWMELNSLGVSSFGLPMARFLHSAVSTDSHMIVMGGRLHPWNVNDTLYAYSYDCNQWINLLSNETRTVGQLPGQTFAQAMTIEPDGDAAYIIGGWGSDSQCSVYRIELPEDLCSVWPKRHGCLHVPGCGFCRNREGDDDGGFCYDNQLECPIGNFGFSPTDLANHSGKKCKGLEILGDCRRFHNCTMCVQAIGCGWCNGACTTNATCPATTLSHCPYSHCQAADCRQCREISGCDWNKLKRKCVKMVHDQPTPSDDRDCQPCVEQTTCTDCLERHDCRWSTQLDECISASYQPIYCAGGVCGLVLQSDDRQYCPEPCSSFSQCSKCLSHAHCGWCAVPGETGEGICTDGSSEKPKLESCANVHALMKDMEVDFDPTNISYTWHYIKCPPENECENDHHSCEEESEVCVDLEEGFQCVCGSGYKLGLNGCEPVCQQGCVRGQCVHPNKCQCDFGYVGANCSIQCVCNGHSDCEGPDKLDKCLKCHNNTMGDRCEKCLPFFVGDPTNNGQCVSCLEYCNGHTDVCVDNNLQLPEPPPDTDLHRFYQFVVEGPKEEARCIHCANYTTGDRCEKCIDGNFRGSEDHRDPCKPCMCHGHGDTCDPVTGDNCNCQNNTESDVCSGSGSVGKNSATPCYMVQCSKCKEGYLGTPKDGHQCYKTLQVDLKMCFDAKPIDECKAKPRALHPGEMVFFAIQPRYMNVNIRIMIDVTQGELNVFMSTHDDTYLAYPNSSLLLDDQYKQYNGSRRSEEILDEQDAVGLRTYITVRNPKTILAVRGLTDRLVITLPEEYHKLETTRFYLVLQAVDPPDTDKKAAYGTVFARQDQLHIDLFVFFSVFFSCFFLFLAACVVAWKAKQAADIRRARRRHVVEMLHMAKRPFATVTLNLGPRIKPKKSAHYDLRPVAVEPTDDGLAAVATVFVSLPGGNSPTVKLALASSLILLARQFPSGGRAFLRRRSTHAAPPI